jgi:hypothetical protein
MYSYKIIHLIYLILDKLGLGETVENKEHIKFKEDEIILE